MLVLAAVNIYILFFHRKKMASKLKEIQLLESEKKILIFKAATEAEERERERIARVAWTIYTTGREFRG